MGNEKSLQFESKNGYKYIYSQNENCWYEVRKTEKLPIDVINQIKELQEKADILKESLKGNSND